MSKKPKPLGYNQFDTQGATSYRLRMVFNGWYYHLLKDGVYFAEIGPMTYEFATKNAHFLAIPDEDKKEVKAHERK